MEKVLLVDDDPAIRKTIKRHLVKNGFEVVEAEDGEVALGMVEIERPHLILLDVMMPKMDGFEVCRKLRHNVRNHEIYIIFLSAKSSVDDKVTGLEYGADDYLAKPFDPKELIARVRTGVRTISEKRSSTYDHLTQIYNRYFFNSFLRQEADRSERYKIPLSMLIIDIDFFKKVNDTYGHLAGDKVLIELADILRERSRKIDIPARWGGEEFVILLPETSLEGAVIFGERLRERIEEHDFPEVGKLTVSVGAAQLDGNEIGMIENADKALYYAKEHGRNRLCTTLDLGK